MDMEQMDAAKAARVWQRVQNRESGEPLRPENGSLIRAAVEQAGYYRVLSRAMPGRVGERLRDFARRQQRSADCLRGICRLTGVPLPPEQAGTVRPQQPRQMLERCCREERRLVEEYTARAGDPEWGRVYAHLATEAGERCCLLLEILGGMGRPEKP